MYIFSVLFLIVFLINHNILKSNYRFITVSQNFNIGGPLLEMAKK